MLLPKLRPGDRARLDAGFALIDVTMSLLVLVIAMGVLLGSVFSALRLSQVNESTAAASQTLRGMIETMNAMPLADVLAAYNSDPSDDPDPDRNRDSRLTVPERLVGREHGGTLTAQATFPLDDKNQIREDLVAPELGLPRDLNGDGKIDTGDHSADLRVLPVNLKLEWVGPSGPQVVQFSTLLRGRE